MYVWLWNLINIRSRVWYIILGYIYIDVPWASHMLWMWSLVIHSIGMQTSWTHESHYDALFMSWCPLPIPKSPRTGKNTQCWPQHLYYTYIQLCMINYACKIRIPIDSTGSHSETFPGKSLCSSPWNSSRRNEEVNMTLPGFLRAVIGSESMDLQMRRHFQVTIAAGAKTNGKNGKIICRWE